jgi:hypothetical protein
MLAVTLIVLAASLIIAVSIQFQGIGEIVMSYGDAQSEQAFELAQSCTNDTLLKLKSNANYGGVTLNISGGTCTTVVTGSGTSRTISSSATIGQSIRKINTTITISGGVITITGWSEDIS